MGRGATATGGSTAKTAPKATSSAEASATEATATEATAPDYRTEATAPTADTRRAIGMTAVLTLADRHLPAISIDRDRSMVSLHTT